VKRTRERRKANTHIIPKLNGLKKERTRVDARRKIRANSNLRVESFTAPKPVKCGAHSAQHIKPFASLGRKFAADPEKRKKNKGGLAALRKVTVTRRISPGYTKS